MLEAKGYKNKEHALRTYVNAVPQDCLRARVATFDTRALDLAPLSLALSKRVESDTTTWPPFFEAVSGGLGAGTMLTPGRVARHAYIEAMLFRTMADVES